ncbi:hypothetical protein N5D03_10560 [Empedobacter sp. GD03861]|uniref:hypothetical protein n=1 Tax=Empedobacter sp. GD03861 TaxID=2975390 RepID=UPI00244D2BAD|nr:hypothetical protein [Empedobacter sp. GD03861]MDH0674983.1 hypothetical protein [Empedobacter sp. GD03861]
MNKTLLSNYVYENFLTNNYFNTALWRGYMATYEIVNNKVVLEDIKSFKMKNSNDSNNIKSETVINNDIEKLIENNPINNVIILSDTDDYYEEKSFENGEYFVLEIENSKVTKSFKFNYNQLVQFKRDQFKLFSKTKTAKNFLSECKKDAEKQYQDSLEKGNKELASVYKKYDCKNILETDMFFYLNENNIYRKILNN